MRLLEKLKGIRSADFFSTLLDLYMVEPKYDIAFDMANYYCTQVVAKMDVNTCKVAMHELLETIMHGDDSKRAKFLNLLEHFILEDEHNVTGTLHSTISMVIENALLSGNASVCLVVNC